MKPESITHFFNPSSIAVIGASNRKNTIGYTIFQNMLRAKKRVFAINPNHAAIQGQKSFPSVRKIKNGIGLAVIAVPARSAPQALQECMEKKIRAAIIVSSGFSETGESELTGKIAGLIKKFPRTRVMGPNCVGVVDTHSGIDTTFFVRSRMKPAKAGSLAFISQSGALGSMILDWAATQQFGISKFVSYGNAMDVDEADMIEYLGSDSRTKVITAYMEGAKSGRKFYNIARKVSQKKPIVVLKGGRSEETTRAAASHTGSLAGAARVYDAVFRQAGVIQAEDLLDLFGIAKMLEEEPLPRGNRVQIVTNGGGFGIVTADQLQSSGLRLAKLSSKTVKKLRKEMPKATISNPLDILGDADVHRYSKAISACLADSNVDILVVLALFSLPTLNPKKLALMKAAGKKARKPVIVISIGSGYTQQRLAEIEKAGFTTFSYPGAAARAVKGVVDYAQYLRKIK